MRIKGSSTLPYVSECPHPSTSLQVEWGPHQFWNRAYQIIYLDKITLGSGDTDKVKARRT